MNRSMISPNLSPLLAAARQALQWRLLLLWSALVLAPALVLALPLWGIIGGALDHSVHAPALAHQLDALSAFDLIAALGQDGMALKTAGLISVCATLLLSPLLSGMAVTAVRSAGPARFGQLITGGLHEYGRMARMLVWSAVPLGAALALGGVILKLVAHHNEAAITEQDAAVASMLGAAAALLLFGIAHATVEAGRAVLAVAPRRSSAVKAWWLGLKLLVRRPLAAMAVWLAVGAVGLVLAAIFAMVRIRLPALGAGSALLGLLLTQAAALALAWTRTARLFGLSALARAQSPSI